MSIFTPNSYSKFSCWMWQINADKIIAMQCTPPHMMRVTVQVILQNEIVNDYLLYKNHSC